jgi:hypothetical protein
MPGNGVTMDHLRALAEVLVEHRDYRIAYLIIDDRIISSTVRPWEWRKYSGKRHVHLHVSRNDKSESSTERWNLVRGTMAVQDDIWSYDIDPSGNSYSAKGVLWSLFGRVPTNMATIVPLLQALTTEVQGLRGDVVTLRADNVHMKAQLTALTAEPSFTHPVVKAAEFAEDNEPPA